MKNIENLPEKTGIYLVTNLINGRKYVGQSLNIRKRFFSHHLSDYKNPNCEIYDTKFYQALRKYGIDNFEVTVLELCEPAQLDELEIKYIKQFNSFKEGYNSTEGGQYWTPNIHSLETEEKRRQTREKNQSLKSENHPRAKLTNQEVLEIRQRYIDGESAKDIYEDYKDLYSNIGTLRRIILGKTYTSVGNIPTKSQVRYSTAKLTEQQVKEIRELYAKGNISYQKIGDIYNVSPTTVMDIVKRRHYKNVD